LLTLLVSGATWPAHAAQIIGLKFGNGSASPTMNGTPTGDIAGAPGVRTTNWNSAAITANFGTAALTPTDNQGNNLLNPADGATTAATVTTGQLTGNPGTGSGANDAKLYGSIWDHDVGTEGLVTIADLPWTNYLVFCYTRPDQGSATSPRGGYWSIRNTVTNQTYITNIDLTVTNFSTIITNYTTTRWLKEQDINLSGVPTPDASGNNYLQSFTSVAPTTFAGIQQGNFVVLPGDTNGPQISYTTNIDLGTATTNVVATSTNYLTQIYFEAVGGGANGVSGGDSARRFKVAGLQIVKLPAANLTNIFLASAIPKLLAGNTTPTAFSPYGQYDDGDTFPLALLSSTTYTSQDTNIFTVASGLISPKHGGITNLIITSGNFSSTQSVTVLPPVAISIPAPNPNVLYKGNNAADTVQAQLRANFAGYLTNSAYSNVTVAAYNYVTFSGGPTNILSVASNGLVTAVSTNGNSVFSLHATFESLAADLTGAGTVKMFPQPSKVACFGANITAVGNFANFKDLTGAPGNRQAYWNNLVYNIGSTTSPSNAIVNPWDYAGNFLTNTTVVWTGQGFGSATATITTNEYVTFHYAYDDGGAGGGAGYTVGAQRAIVITNVPYSTYDAYFYFWNDTGNAARIGHVTAMETLETRWRANMATLTGSLDGIAPNPASTNGAGYNQAVPIISGGSIPNGVYPASLAQVPGGNYIKFTGLTNKTATFMWGPDGTDTVPGANNTCRLRIAAFQIVKNLNALTPTNLYLGGAAGPLFPGNSAGTSLTVFADFTDGTVGGNVTDLSSYSSSNPNVFSVTNGVVTAGLTPGTANLVVTFKTLSLTQAVTTLAPVSVTVKAKPDTAYIDGANGAQAGTLEMFATFSGYTNVNISSYTNTVSWNDVTPSVATVSDTGVPPSTSTVTIIPVAVGTADLSGNYLGVAHTNLAGFSVRSVSDAISLTNDANLKHRYSFRDTVGSSTVVDSVGGANGTIVSPLTGGLPVTLDGEQANFPSNNVYQTSGYIKLPVGIISERGDITIDMWCGMNEAKPWARIFDFGSSSKGNDSHNDGNGITSLFFSPLPGGNANPIFDSTMSFGQVQLVGTSPFVIGTEQHVTLVYSYNQNTMKLYINGALVNSATPAFGNTLQTLDDQNVWLGVSQWQDPVLNGWINELRIYEGAFADSDVAASDLAGPHVGLSTVSTTPTPITYGVTGNTLTLSWPGDHTGWRLQTQTNALNGGLGTNWVDWPDAASTNQVAIPIVNANRTVFFRLVYP
jgi:hypothetical protein